MCDGAVEIVLVGALDGDGIEAAHCERRAVHGDEDFAIDFGRVELGASDVEIALDAVDDGAERLSDLGLAEFGRDAGLQFHQGVEALLLDFCRDVVGVVSGGVGALFLAVSKGAHAVEPYGAHKVYEFGKFLVGLAGETDHERGADGDAGHLFAELADELVGLGFGGVAAHACQDAVADVLEGDVEVAAHVGVAAHHGQEVHRETGGVGVMQAYPFDPGDAGHAVDEFGQALAAVAVDTVVGEFLGYDLEFPYAAGHEAAHLVEDLVDGAADVVPGDDGDGAVGAFAVAAFRNLDVGVVGRGGQDTFEGDVFVVTFAEVAQQVGPVELAVELVDLWDFFAQFLEVAFGEAPHYVDAAEPAFFFKLAELEDHVDALFLGVADEAAGVDHGDAAMGLFGVVVGLVTEGFELTEEVLGVDKVFRAAHCDDVDGLLLHGVIIGCRQRASRRTRGCQRVAGRSFSRRDRCI